MNIYKEIRALEKKGIFIDFIHEYYTSGTNCNFQIWKVKKGKKIWGTGSYGDNGEFGDVADAMVCAIKIAKWFSKRNNAKRYFKNFEGTTLSNEGRNQWLRIHNFRNRADRMIDKLTKNKR